MLEATVGDRWSPAELGAAAELLERFDGKFPAGVQTVPPDLIRTVQRERLLVAMLSGAAQLGYRDLAVEDVIRRAGVSRPTFYVSFDNKEDCFLVALDAVAERLRDRVETAAGAGGPHWRDRLRAGIEELLRFVSAEPDAARALVVESRTAGTEALLRRDRLVDRFALCIDAQVREELPAAPSAITAAGVVGGIEAVLYARLRREETDDLASLLPSLMYFAVLPYAGREAAAKEPKDADGA
jgi:AcrR family transcriptional regulator